VTDWIEIADDQDVLTKNPPPFGRSGITRRFLEKPIRNVE